MKQFFFTKKQRKTLINAAGLVATALFVSRQAQANSACIWEPELDYTEVVDDGTILFHMHGHKVWKNVLQVSCFGLKHEPDGFTYQPTDPSIQELCSNQVTIRLNSLRSICQLGDFTRVK